MMRGEFASRLLKSRFHPPQDLRRLLEAPVTSRRNNIAAMMRLRRRRRPQQQQQGGEPHRYIKGIVNGQFVRVKIPTRKSPSKLPKLLNPASPPVKPFSHPPDNKAGVVASETVTLQELTTATQAERKEFFHEYWDRIKAWIKYNFGAIVLNFGSVCSLIGFTRSDVLELRLLSVTGSLSYVVYFLALPGPRDWTPILWTCTFIAVNGTKIYDILLERKGSVVLTKEQQEIYEQYFKPHGHTVKQFQYIIEKARTIRLKKGEVLIREGDVMKDVFLVTSGKTRAHHLGRRLTAVSFLPRQQTRDPQGAAASAGAFVGEMAFFELQWHKNHDNGEYDKSEERLAEVRRKAPATERAMYTVVALEDDTTVLAWSHADMQALLDRSGDMRAALTTMMTAAIVGKVVGFANSKKKTSRWSWSTLLWPPSWWDGSRASATTGTLQSARVVETPHPPKAKVNEKPLYSVSDGKGYSAAS